jgi:hypothetical protein
MFGFEVTMAAVWHHNILLKMCCSSPNPAISQVAALTGEGVHLIGRRTAAVWFVSRASGVLQALGCVHSQAQLQLAPQVAGANMQVPALTVKSCSCSMCGPTEVMLNSTHGLGALLQRSCRLLHSQVRRVMTRGATVCGTSAQGAADASQDKGFTQRSAVAFKYLHVISR